MRDEDGGNEGREPENPVSIVWIDLRFHSVFLGVLALGGKVVCMPFVQPPPELGNQYEADPSLRSYLARTLPADVLRKLRSGCAHG